MVRVPPLSQVGLNTPAIKCAVCEEEREWTHARNLKCLKCLRDQRLEGVDELQMEDKKRKNLEMSAPYTTSDEKPGEH